MAIAVSVSAAPMTAYAASDVSDSASVNAESQTESEVPNPEETPAQEPAAAPDAEADAAAEVSEKPSSEQTAADTPSVQSEEDGALSVPSGENTAASEASEESAAPSAQSAGEAAEGERARKTVYEAGWNQVKDAEGNDHWIFYDAQTGAPKTGLFTEGGKTYLAAADTGYLLTGAQTYTDENGVAHVYCSSEEGGQPGAESAYGTIVKDGFADVDGQTRYFDKDGKMYTQEGWITVQDKTYYIMNGAVCKNGNYATDPTSGWLILDGEWYLLDTADGHRLSGLQKNGNDLYYLDPEQNDKMFKSTNQEDGWKQLNGTWYFFRGWGGALNNGWNKLGNDWYWFHEDCSMASAEWIREGGNLYYVRDWGGMLHDQWRKENGIWYYFRGWGAALNNGWSKIGNDWYWFNSDCKMGSDQWLQQGNDWYYLRDWGGRLHDQWYKVGNDWYYFGSDGKMLHDQWLQQGNNWYYLRGWGGRLHDQWFTKDGKTYYFQSSGVRYQNGTFVIDGKSYTFDANGCRVDAGWTYIDGYRRYRNADGSLSNDVSAIFNPSSKYITVDRIRGITTIYGYNSETGKYDTPIKSMWCSVGNPITLSAAGTYNIGWQLRSKKMVGAGNSYVCWASYVSQIYGAVYFHGVASGSPDLNSVAKSDFEALGRPMSHGCIRLAACDAKWIYENVKGGTTVQIGDNFGCPMSNPVRYQWTGGAYGPDPTYS